MFGLHNVGIWLVFLLCFLSAFACIIYGVINWNKGADDEEKKHKNKKEQKGDKL